MPYAFDRVEFAPPPQPGTVRAIGLAVLAHLLLVGALTWGVNWKSQSAAPTSAQAELWASVPQQAAPRLVQPPVPQQLATPRYEPKPAPTPTPAPAPAKAPDIVEKVDKPIKKPVAKPPSPLVKPDAKPEPVKPSVDPALAKKEAAKKAADEAKQLDAQRQENLKRITGLAGASGAPSATGNAPQSAGAGVSKAYGDRVANAVRPNIVFTGDAPASARVELDIRLAPDGTIVGKPRVTQSSGYPDFDEAVVRGFEKTSVLPRAEDGRVPSSLPIGWSRRNTN